VNVEVTTGGQSESGVVFISHDGRYLLRGELFDTSVDPFAPSRSQMRLDANPSKGPADARVTVVEYSDFQCPHCRELHQTLRVIHPLYPQVRFVFKDFPLTQIHPWAMTAAVAGRCAFEQNADAFWAVHDAIFDNQDSIKPEDAWQKMIEFSTQAGLQPDAFRVCMTSPEAKEAVQRNIEEAKALKVANTPTVFVNGRRVVGGDRGLLEQYINYELAASAANPKR
jgi:protein-disulfide isomerase